ncbi:MAG: alpha/beta hydrolase [Parvularculaceae bacterium]|nr:alpha/beta hydrolase [Parvularculaceae bacterium]
MAGRSEFIEKYFEVIKDLQARGFNVATMDWRGQGLSERMLPIREKGHIQDFDIYKADLRRFTEQVAMTRFAGPYVLMTHSMGGAPGLQLLADGYEKFVGAVLSAPMTRLFDDLAKRVGARAMARLGCALGASRHSVLGVKEYSLDFEGNVLTSDRDRHERFRALQAEAPNAAIREPTYGWLRAALAAMDDLHRPGRFEGLKVPVRIISAELDYLVSSRDHKWLAQQSPLIDCITIKGSMHEIMMERDECRNQYWAAFDEFVEPLIASQKSAKR